MNLVVAIGLVLSISGTAYAAIASLHTQCGENVKTFIRVSKDCHERLGKRGNESLIGNRDRHWNSFHWWLKIWNWSRWVPIGLLGITSFAIAIDALLLDWAGTAEIFSQREWWWYKIYKYGLVVLMVADLLAVFAALSSYFMVRSATTELEGYDLSFQATQPLEPTPADQEVPQANSL